MLSKNFVLKRPLGSSWTISIRRRKKMAFEKCINFLLNELKGCTRPEVAGVRPKRDEIRTKTTEYPPLRLDQARLLSSL